MFGTKLRQFFQILVLEKQQLQNYSQSRMKVQP